MDIHGAPGVMIVDLWLWFSLVVSAALFIQFILNLLLLPRLLSEIAPDAPHCRHWRFINPPSRHFP